MNFNFEKQKIYLWGVSSGMIIAIIINLLVK